MGYPKITTCIYCFILLGSFASGNRVAIQDGILRTDTRQTFYNEIGVHEVGGDNRGKRVEQYLKACGLGPGYPWCACFLAWGFNENSIDNPESAWSPDWFPSSQTIYTRGSSRVDNDKWMPADVVGFYFSRLGRIAHVGTIDTTFHNTVITIEGNSNDNGSRRGTRVVRKRRYTRQIYKVSRYIPEGNNN